MLQNHKEQLQGPLLAELLHAIVRLQTFLNLVPRVSPNDTAALQRAKLDAAALTAIMDRLQDLLPSPAELQQLGPGSLARVLGAAAVLPLQREVARQVLAAGVPVFLQQVAAADKALLASHICIVLEVLAMPWVQEEAIAAAAIGGSSSGSDNRNAVTTLDEQQLSPLLTALHGRVYVASDAITALVSLARLAPKKLCTTRQLLPEMLSLLQRQGSWWQQALVLQQLAAAAAYDDSSLSAAAAAVAGGDDTTADLSSPLPPTLQQALLSCVTRVIDHTHTQGLGLQPADDWEEWNKGHQQAVVAAVKGYCKLMGGIEQAGMEQLERPLVDYIMGHLLGSTGKLPEQLQPVGIESDVLSSSSGGSSHQQQQELPGPLYMLCTMAVADPGIWPHDPFVPLKEQEGEAVVMKVAQQAGEMLGELLALPGDLGVMVARQVLPALPLGSNVKLAVLQDMVKAYWGAAGVRGDGEAQEGAEGTGSSGSNGVLARRLFVGDVHWDKGSNSKAAASSSSSICEIKLSDTGYAFAALLGSVGDLVPLELLVAPLGLSEDAGSASLINEVQEGLQTAKVAAAAVERGATAAQGGCGWQQLQEMIVTDQVAAKKLLKVDEGVLGIWWSLFQWPKEYEAPAAAEEWGGRCTWLQQLLD